MVSLARVGQHGSSVLNITSIGDAQGKAELTPVAIAADRLLGDRLFCLPEFNKLSYGNISMIVFSCVPTLSPFALA